MCFHEEFFTNIANIKIFYKSFLTYKQFT